MNIGIIYIGLGNYISFWESFYLTAEKYLFPENEKKYYVFTDADFLYGQDDNSLICKIFQNDLGWPGNTLYRFKMIVEQSARFSLCDYLFFFNGNAFFTDYVLTKELLPTASDLYLVCLSWHIYGDKLNNEFPYERNPVSKACIPFGMGTKYYQGGLNGGRTKEYLEMVSECMIAVDIDTSSGIVAISNDESYLNKFLIDKKIKSIGTKYGKPEEWEVPQDCKIIFRNKNVYLGEKYMRNLKPNLFQKKTIRGVICRLLNKCGI